MERNPEIYFVDALDCDAVYFYFSIDLGYKTVLVDQRSVYAILRRTIDKGSRGHDAILRDG